MALTENGMALLHCEDFTDSLSMATITNHGAIISSEQSKFGEKSLYFSKDNGGSYLTIDVEGRNSYTIEFWMYVVGDNTNYWYPTPISTNTTNDSGGTYIHVDDGHYNTLPVCRVNTANAGGNHSSYGTTVITRENWHHIAICKDDTKHYFFIDGNLQTTVTQSSSDVVTTWYFGGLRGRDNMRGECYFTGYIDEILISSVCKWTDNFEVPTEAYSVKIETTSKSMIYMGDTKINNIYVCDTKVLYMYIGDNLIYSSSSNEDIPSINTSVVTEGLIANLCEFDIDNRKMVDIVNDYDLTIIGNSTTINDNKLVVAPTNSSQGNIVLPMTTLTQFTFSYVVESEWDSSQPTQIIGGSNSTTFYMWLMTTESNVWYKNVKIIDDSEYVTVGEDNIRFIDFSLDVVNGTLNLYINGELKVSKSGLSLSQATENNLYLNNVLGWTSRGDFTLYSFKVYNRCLDINEVKRNIDYEKERLGWL